MCSYGFQVGNEFNLAGVARTFILVVAVGCGVVDGDSRGGNVLISMKVFLIGPAVRLIFGYFNAVLAGARRGVRKGEVYSGVRGDGKVYDGISLGAVEIIRYAAGPLAFRA